MEQRDDRDEIEASAEPQDARWEEPDLNRPMPPLPPPDKGELLRQFLPIAVGELLLSGLMLGVYALLGAWSGKVLAGAALGTLAAYVNFTVMVLALLRAERAATPAKGQLMSSGSFVLRMLVLLAVLVLALKSGRFEPLATLLPLCFLRITLFIPQFGKKKEAKS